MISSGIYWLLQRPLVGESVVVMVESLAVSGIRPGHESSRAVT